MHMVYSNMDTLYPPKSYLSIMFVFYKMSNENYLNNPKSLVFVICDYQIMDTKYSSATCVHIY